VGENGNPRCGKAAAQCPKHWRLFRVQPTQRGRDRANVHGVSRGKSVTRLAGGLHPAPICSHHAAVWSLLIDYVFDEVRKRRRDRDGREQVVCLNALLAISIPRQKPDRN